MKGKATVMADKPVFVLDKVPEGSRLEKYLKELPEVLRDKEKAPSFLHKVFRECLDFVWQNVRIPYLPRITVKFVPSHDQFKREEERESKDSISKEAVKKPEMTRSFTVGNKFSQRIYIDLKAYTDLLRFNYLTFIMNLVTTYIHEILHIGFPKRYEQEIHDLECSLVETFLGIELPKEIKNLKASDYYSAISL